MAAIANQKQDAGWKAQRWSELSMNDIVWRILSCSAIRFFTSLQACNTVP